MNIEKIKREIQYSYPEIPYFEEYFDVNSMILNTATPEMLAAIEKDGVNAVKSCTRKFYESIRAGRDIIDGTKSEVKVLPPEAVLILSNISVINNPDSIEVYNMMEGTFDITVKGYRSSIVEIFGVCVNKETRFKLRSSMLIYGNEKYSLAFRLRDRSFGFALIGEPRDRGNKGILKVSYFTDKAYFIDDASKYIDVQPFVKGLS